MCRRPGGRARVSGRLTIVRPVLPLPDAQPGELVVPFDEAIAMVKDGRITDAKSVAALLWFKTWGG